MKKYKSGWEKEKSRREAEAKLKKVVAGSKKVTDFFDVSEPKSNIAETTSSRPNATALRPSTSSDCIAEPEPHINIVSSEPNLKTKSSNVAEDETHGVKETIQHDMDVGCWGVISDQLRDYCCQIGSLEFQHLDADFSTSETCITGDKFKRRFSKSLFWREQLNGEIVKREWLCYSPSTKKLYCFVCKLFASDSEKIMLASVGYGDWKHAPRDLARHESTNKHLSYLSTYFFRRAKKGSICKDLEEQKESDRKYWSKVLARVLSVIKFLSSRGLAFRGSSERVGSPQNGNFLGILELLAEYDTFLAEHIQKRVNKGKGHVSYFSSTVCEEFIDAIATKVLNIIISEIKQAKYYSVSVDSTPDIANVDQLTIIFRYVLPDGPVERFVKFMPTRGHTGHQLADILLEFIEDNGISLKDLRGQSYDNAANMSGKYKGMQAIIKERNHQAEYIPCVAHSLNLVGKCAAECCQSAVRFFMFVQGLYVFFSTSTHRWNLLVDALEPLQCPTIKPLSDTRWEARYDALHALRKGYQAVLQVLKAISDDNNKTYQTKETARGFVSSMKKLETGILLEVWSCIMERFHKTSQALQDSKMTLNKATNLLQSLQNFIQLLRPQFQTFEGRGQALSGCHHYTEEISRKKRRKVGLDSEGESEDTSLDSSSRFEVDSYLPIIDQILSSMKTRLEAYDGLQRKFSFLIELNTMSNCKIEASAKSLLQYYPDDLEESLPEEMIHFSTLIKQHHFNSKCKEIQMFKFINENEFVHAFPNVSVVFRLYLCLMISNCSGERSFSALKRVKNHLRSSMGQKRLNSLALLCIENDILQKIDTDDIIKSFALSKSRKCVI